MDAADSAAQPVPAALGSAGDFLAALAASAGAARADEAMCRERMGPA